MADEQRKIGLALIGAGMGAKPHALALNSLKDKIDVVGVYRRDQAQLKEFCDSYALPAATDLDALIADPRVDAVLLVTTPNARLEIVEKAAKAGKHILSEKPIERTLAAAEEIVALADAAGVKLGIIFQHRFRAASKALTSKVKSGELGRLQMVHLTVPWWRPQEGYYDKPGRGTFAQDGGGVLITQAIHALDLMLSLTGPVKSVNALVATTGIHTMETEDFVSAGLEFESGAVGSLMATTACYPGGAESLTLAFDKATATLSGGTLTLSYHDGRVESVGEPTVSGGGADPMAFPFDWHAAQIADFADAILEDRQPVSTGHSALHVHRLIDALIASGKAGAKVTL
ncbi:Gfo/Idh/MocA family oxidoreductase [Devosia sp. MC1541]|uniref:Gfo/Idh/MocA family protein n=1 Tax=Devosia sp. MC1541 TaxID=2725264 RepID=UPI00145F3E26|nr:Gfo/Idh/MocA family oxidoreductase [Devosia sp. MC1541]